MGFNEVLALAKLFGPIGLFVGYLIWEGMRRDKARTDREAAERVLTKDRIETDKAVATALTALATKIDGMRR